MKLRGIGCVNRSIKQIKKKKETWFSTVKDKVSTCHAILFIKIIITVMKCYINCYFMIIIVIGTGSSGTQGSESQTLQNGLGLLSY